MTGTANVSRCADETGLKMQRDVLVDVQTTPWRWNRGRGCTEKFGSRGRGRVEGGWSCSVFAADPVRAINLFQKALLRFVCVARAVKNERRAKSRRKKIGKPRERQR